MSPRSDTAWGPMRKQAAELAPLYHGTSATLEPGQEVLPPSATGASPRVAGEPSQIWMSLSINEAGKYGPNVYQVIPEGKVRRGNPPQHVRIADSATVLRALTREEILDGVWGPGWRDMQ